MMLTPKIDETEISVAEALSLHAHLHQHLSRLAYRVTRWTEEGSGLDWSNAETDSRQEMEATRAELCAAGYLYPDGGITDACSAVD